MRPAPSWKNQIALALIPMSLLAVAILIDWSGMHAPGIWLLLMLVFVCGGILRQP